MSGIQWDNLRHNATFLTLFLVCPQLGDQLAGITRQDLRFAPDPASRHIPLPDPGKVIPLLDPHKSGCILIWYAPPALVEWLSL